MASDESATTKSFADDLKKMPDWKQELLLKRKNLLKTNVSSAETLDLQGVGHNGAPTILSSEGMHTNIEWGIVCFFLETLLPWVTGFDLVRIYYLHMERRISWFKKFKHSEEFAYETE